MRAWMLTSVFWCVLVAVGFATFSAVQAAPVSVTDQQLNPTAAGICEEECIWEQVFCAAPCEDMPNPNGCYMQCYIKYTNCIAECN